MNRLFHKMKFVFISFNLHYKDKLIMIKKVLFLLIIIGIIGGSIRYYLYNKPKPDIKKSNTDLSIASDSLLLSFENNEAEANKKYLNKVIEVEGKVVKIEDNQSKQRVIMLEAPSSIMGGYVSVTMDSSDKENYNSIKENDVVKLKCICNGYTMDVVLTNGTVVIPE